MRKDSDATKGVSTVDDPGVPMGQASVVHALVEQSAGGVGQYGVAAAPRRSCPTHSAMMASPGPSSEPRRAHRRDAASLAAARRSRRVTRCCCACCGNGRPEARRSGHAPTTRATPVTLLEGPAYAAGAAWPRWPPAGRPASGAVAGLGAAAFGALDDLAGDSGSKGLRATWPPWPGRVTTGAVKIARARP